MIIYEENHMIIYEQKNHHIYEQKIMKKNII